MKSRSIRRSALKRVKSKPARKVVRSKASQKASLKNARASSKANLTSATEVPRASVGQRGKTEDEPNRLRRLEIVEALAGGIAHDINNALTAIMHNVYAAKMFLANEDRREEVPHLLDAGMKTIRRATALTNRLLAFSAEGSPLRKAIYIKNVIRDSSKFSLSGSNVRCEFHIDDDLWPAYVDEGQVVQVISNLIINAKHAMPGGGTIDVTAKNVNLGKDEVPHLKGDRYIKLSLRCLGTGIPKEHLKNILDAKDEGSDPGIAASYSIVKQNGGLITIESEESVGTTFHVYLPASRAVTETEPESGGGIEGGNVLVMESEEDIVDSMRFALTLLGYETEFVKDGTSAIAAYEKAMKSGRPFDVVILDLTVPGGMGGVETISALKKKYPDIMAVIASGYSNDPVMTDYERYGFMAAIEKPHNVEDLDRLLRRLMAAKGGRQGNSA